MASKIPPSAFSDYLAMGVGRSYEALAKRYGCSKKCVTQRAVKERWQERARELEREAASRVEKKIQVNLRAKEKQELLAPIVADATDPSTSPQFRPPWIREDDIDKRPELMRVLLRITNLLERLVVLSGGRAE